MPFISPIRAFSDNYIWLIEGDSNHACVVDPGDAVPVLDTLHERDLKLTHILITHKHNDHIGGIRQLQHVFPDVIVFGPANEPIAAITHPLTEGDQIDISGIKGTLEVIEVPGHTEGHIAYHGVEDGIIFCGDTLFMCGCGRVFSGTHQQLSTSLRKIATLPSDTLLYCTHEYTMDNIGFAKWVEPANSRLLQREQDVAATLKKDQPSVPGTLQLELETNPFMRTQIPNIVKAAEKWAGRKLNSHAEVFHALRDWKDQEYD